MRRVYVMRPATLTLLIKLGRSTCYRCGSQFAIGERVTTKTGTTNTRYHERCLEGMRV